MSWSDGPLIDASWQRAPLDEFKTEPHPNTRFDNQYAGSGESDAGSEWSYEDESELITLDLGSERVARRALLGFGAPSSADFVAASGSGSLGGANGSAVGGSSSWSTARSVRASRPTEKTTEPSAAFTSSAPSALKSHLGAGKMLSLTGLDTATPILKIDNTVLRGKRVDMLGTEIVLTNHIDATKPKGSQYRLRPIPSADAGHPTTCSSTTRKRITFTPIYDPTDNERLPADVRHNHIAQDLREAVNAVKTSASATPKHRHSPDAQPQPPSSTAVAKDPTNTAKRTRSGEMEEEDTAEEEAQTLPEEELLVRRAERTIKKAARAFRKQQKRENEQQQ